MKESVRKGHGVPMCGYERVLLFTVKVDNIQRMGKYHCTVGLHLNMTGFDQTRQSIVICVYCNYSIRTGQSGDLP